MVRKPDESRCALPIPGGVVDGLGGLEMIIQALGAEVDQVIAVVSVLEQRFLPLFDRNSPSTEIAIDRDLAHVPSQAASDLRRAGEGNRTPVSSLGSLRSAVELHPLGPVILSRGLQVHPIVSDDASRIRAVILSDVDIRKEVASGRVVIDPFDENAVQPSSVDLRVDRWFRVFANSRYPYIDVKEPMDDLTELVEASDDQPLILHPGEFILGSTLERVSLPDDLVARVEGKSSLGRLGLLIHSTAGFVDAGWDGHLTLELSNVANLPITIYPEMKIGQLCLFKMSSPAERPYGSKDMTSKYQGQKGPTASRYYKNFESK